MKIISIPVFLKERIINFSLIYFTLTSKNYNYKNKSPGSVVGLSSGPVANLIEV